MNWVNASNFEAGNSLNDSSASGEEFRVQFFNEAADWHGEMLFGFVKSPKVRSVKLIFD